MTADPASLTFTTDNWDILQTVTVAAAQDNDDDDGTATIKHDVSGYGSVIASDVSVSVTDDAPETVEVSFEQGSYTVAEGGSVTVKVKLDEDPERTVTIPLTKTGQGGASSADYSGVPANVVFNSGDTEKTFDFSADADSDNDDGESVKLAFGDTLPAGVSAGSTNEATVSITDDDVPSVTVSFEQGSYTVAEGGSVTVKVKLDEDPERTVTIPLTKTGQGGASSADYSGVPANVVFNAEDTEKTFDFSGDADSDNDDGESVKLAFDTLPTGVSAGSTDEATVSITDDDVPSVTVSFEQGSYTVAEGGSVTVKVKLDEDPERTVTIPLTKTGQGGASSADYSGVPANVVFNAGDTEKTFDFSADADSDNDDGESVKLAFGDTLPAGVSAGSTDEATVSITDDDLPSSVTVEFVASSYSVDESGDVEVKVTLSEDPEPTVTIPLTKGNQGGASDSDYSGVPSSLTFHSGDTEMSFTFEAAQDNLEDSGESVKLGFGTLSTGVSAGTKDEATVSITNVSAQNSLTINFGASEYILTEGDTTMVTVTLVIAPGSEVTIPLTKNDQGGASSADYSGVPASLTFGGSDTSKTFTFTAIEDTIDDDGESVKLAFGDTLPAGVSAGSTNEATVSITDDDVPSVTVSFEQGSYTGQRAAASR